MDDELALDVACSLRAQHVLPSLVDDAAMWLLAYLLLACLPEGLAALHMSEPDLVITPGIEIHMNSSFSLVDREDDACWLTLASYRGGPTAGPSDGIALVQKAMKSRVPRSRVALLRSQR